MAVDYAQILRLLRISGKVRRDAPRFSASCLHIAKQSNNFAAVDIQGSGTHMPGPGLRAIRAVLKIITDLESP
jgi:hypothetical protein